ncbi:hypothetical protein EDEG_00116 [Edhazardia aedis USNM 41457]|uniref:Uncharacterized protein n=1 Tax=Edhazardia aedis (strain USNM 41457) TaxID=1003232 RepID=J9DAV2_EDHAE|nr:hypothetical protein EDEG_00116 [Edhazardia aedis USNM 41457]|eukprot:EJW04896.1 hypothetical protein EDEG_00116 [Edhazardia aedis USNM 41457]
MATGYIQLSLLVVYDIIWMKFKKDIDKLIGLEDVPLKLAFPRFLHGFDMIGMGDIFMIGLFLSIIKNFCDKKQNKNLTIFWWAFIGMNLGLCFTIYSILEWKNPIPALLTMCPGIIIFSSIAAAFCGCFWSFIRYDRSTKRSAQNG